METKQELRDKISFLSEEITSLKQELNNKDIEKEKAVYEAILQTDKKNYERWKESFEGKYIFLLVLEMLSKDYENIIQNKIGKEISKLDIEEYHDNSEFTSESGITLTYENKPLGSVCIESKSWGDE